jgi:His/Glu/Gln/Arg/opine family amino acid ABC transporter permease subunit
VLPAFTPPLVENANLLLTGYLNTVLLSAFALTAALVLGTLMASLRVWGGELLRPIASAYVEIFRNTPFLIQVSFLAVLFAPANLGLTADPLIVGIIALGFYTGAYVTEVVRSGILSVDPRQVEAARSLGFSQVQALRLIVLPQAVRTVIPPLGNLAIALVKNSAIVSAIAAVELLKVAGLIETRTASFDGYLAALVGYWSITVPLAFAVSRLERTLAFAR